MVVDHAIRDECVSSADEIEQLGADQHLAAVSHERREQLEFERGKIHRFAGNPQFSSRRIDFRIAEAEGLRRAVFGPAQC